MAREQLDVGMKCIKYMLFISNFMFAMIGFLLISIGSTIHAIYGDFETFMETHYFSPAALLVAIGVIVFLVAIFGCIGAIKESTCLINIVAVTTLVLLLLLMVTEMPIKVTQFHHLIHSFALMLGLILILQVAAAIAAYSMRGQITENIQNNMEATLYSYEEDELIRETWDFTQEREIVRGTVNIRMSTQKEQSQAANFCSVLVWWQFELISNFKVLVLKLTTIWGFVMYFLQCCGITSPSDWKNHLYNGTEITLNNQTFYVPESCCVYGNCTAVNGRGCLTKLAFIVSECALMLGTGAICVALVQLLGVIFARMLARAIRTVKTEEEMKKQEQRRRLYEQLARGDTRDEKITPVLYTPPYTDKKE